jgi:PIN domain nuclease of toxin-antitoxin system
MTRVAVTDAHALIWYATGFDRRIGRTARAIFARADRGTASIYVPALALVEIGEAVRRGLPIEGGFTRWARALLASGKFVFADLTIDVVVEAEALYAIPERGDRLIAATAIAQGCPLITRDPVFARIPSLATVW